MIILNIYFNVVIEIIIFLVPFFLKLLSYLNILFQILKHVSFFISEKINIIIIILPFLFFLNKFIVKPRGGMGRMSSFCFNNSTKIIVKILQILIFIVLNFLILLTKIFISCQIIVKICFLLKSFDWLGNWTNWSAKILFISSLNIILSSLVIITTTSVLIKILILLWLWLTAYHTFTRVKIIIIIVITRIGLV